MLPSTSESSNQKSPKSIKTTPDFNSMIRITFWNGLGFIFFMFIKSYVVLFYFGGTGVVFGIIMALQPFARLISMPLIAYLTDHSSKKRLVLIGSLGRTLSYSLYWISLVIKDIVLFGVGTFCQGLLVGFFWPPFFSLISDKSSKENRTQALATGRGKMIGYGFLVGAIISIPIFALVSIFMPDNIPLMYSPILIFAILNLIAGYQFHVRVDENLTYEKYYESLDNTNPQLQSLMSNGIIDSEEIMTTVEILETAGKINHKRNRSFLIGFSALIIVILITSMAMTIYSTFISAYLINNLLPEISENIVPIIVMIVYFPAQVLSQLVAPKLGKLFDRISPTISVISVNIFTALMIWLLIGAFTSIDFALILIFLYISLESNGYLIQAIMSRVSIKHRGKVFGLHMWVDRLGRVIGPLVGGLLWDSLTDTAPFIVSIYIVLCLIPFFVFTIRKLSPYMAEKVEIDSIGIMKIKKFD
ncbi:MAG: MFS transporter [Promethearchaeota archaeon]